MGVPLELLEPSKVKKLCEFLNISPKKSLSQNFLCSNSIAQRIVSLVKDEDNIIEIGPGSGALTYYLSQNKNIIAVEKDDFWAKFISNNYKKVHVIHDDILKINNKVYANKTIIGNLPYNISTAIIRTLLSQPSPPSRIIVMLQKEVALRIVSPKSSKLSLGVLYYGQAYLRFLVPSRYFYPQPKVDSAIVEIITHNKYSHGGSEGDLFKLIELAFKSPRKKLSNNLRPIIDTALWSKICFDLKLDINIRPENLNIEQWLNLLALLKR